MLTTTPPLLGILLLDDDDLRYSRAHLTPTLAIESSHSRREYGATAIAVGEYKALWSQTPLQTASAVQPNDAPRNDLQRRQCASRKWSWSWRQHGTSQRLFQWAEQAQAEQSCVYMNRDRGASEPTLTVSLLLSPRTAYEA